MDPSSLPDRKSITFGINLRPGDFVFLPLFPSKQIGANGHRNRGLLSLVAESCKIFNIERLASGIPISVLHFWNQSGPDDRAIS